MPSADFLGPEVEEMLKGKKLESIQLAQVRKNLKVDTTAPIYLLGKRLFHEKQLSRNQNISCASCHIPESGFSNGQPYGTGTHGSATTRHVPHLYNLALQPAFFWDGRAASLEEQLQKVITSKEEMDMSFQEIASRLIQIDSYKQAFAEAFPGKSIDKHSISKALLAYERSLITGVSRFDLYLEGDSAKLNPQEVRGLNLFIGKANCIACHQGPNLSDGAFHNVGVMTSDLGRFKIDKIGMSKEFESTPYPFFSTYKAFKTPSLRQINRTAPYFHDGSKSSLREVIEFYNRGGENPDHTGLAKEIKPLNLSNEEMEDLLRFLESLDAIIPERAYD